MNHEELFDKHLRGELSETELSELKHLLSHDSATGRAFVEHVNEVNLIVRVGSQLQSASPAQNVVPLVIPTASSGKHFRWWRVAAVAACLVGLGVVGMILSRQSSARTTPEMYLSGNNVELTRDGKRMLAGVFELKAGDMIATSTDDMAVIADERELTRFELFPGTVALYGDASAGKPFELRRGTLRVRAAPQPPDKPLLLTTPQAQVTVLGTEFMLRTDERATKLNVLEGKVQLACRANAKGVVVNAGFSATTTSSGTTDARLCCKCPKCRGTNETSNCPNLKKKNEN